MPLPVCFAQGYILAAISASVMIPCMINLIDRGYAKSKGIPTTLITAGVLEDLNSIIIFGICSSIAYEQAK